MPAILVWSLLGAGSLVALAARPRGSVAVLAVTWLLVPGAARIPGAGDGHLFLHRILVAAVLAGLVRAVVLRRIDRRVFAVRGVHVAFGAYLLVALIAGVVLARPGLDATLNTNAFLELTEQAVFFVAALAAFRAAGARTSATIVAGVAGAGAAIGVIEHLTGWSFSQWVTRDLADPSGLMSLDLAVRGEHDRIRVAATFALEYGWVVALLVPVAAAAALGTRGRARLAWLAPAAMVPAMTWTWSRSAYAGLAVGLLVLGLGLVIDRPQQALPLGVIGLVLATVLLQGPLREALDVGVTGEDQDVRLDRLPDVLGLVSDRPLLGTGLGGLLDQRITVVDIGWVNTYATIGVIGVIALAAVLLSASHAGSRFVLAPPSRVRTIAAGATGAVVAAPLGFASYDLGTLRMSTETVWAMAALALVANEQLGLLPVPAVRRGYNVPVPAALLGALGVVGGFALALATPHRTSLDLVYAVEDPAVAAEAPTDQGYTIKVLSQTACVVVDDMALDATVRCQDLDQVAGGTGTVRIEATDAAAVEEAGIAVAERLRDVFPAATVAVSERGGGRPTWAATAPVWMAAAGFALGATAPDRNRRPPQRVLRPGAASGPPLTAGGGARPARPPADRTPIPAAPRRPTPPG
ncbi:MAG TPA: hypothetical protein VFU14_08280 [Acidimicrobiales bacterium]|nr:hypothetical protein [Acidimicrobiales bacterium]